MSIPDDFWTLTMPAGEEPGWDRQITICGTRESLGQQFDLSSVPKGAVLRQGDEARQFMKKSLQEEMQYQREQELKRSHSRN